MSRFGLVIAFVIAFACGAPQASEPVISQADAERIATDTGRDNEYDMNVYQLKNSRLDDDGSWWVHFEHAPPTPPGGHFAVEVDGETGEARLMHGE